MAARAQSSRLRQELVRALEDEGWIRSAPVRDAFLDVPRELFVPEFAEAQGLAAVYRDEAILTKQDLHGVPLSSSSQPAIMAAMLEQLRLEEGMSVLEIGAGTGYNAALLSLLVGQRGRVVSVEIDPEIARGTRQRLRAHGYKARVVVGDGREGFAALAPYDRIIVTASTRHVPVAWFDQLNAQGLVEAPLQLSTAGAQAIPLLRKQGRGFRSTAVICGGFMPLREAREEAAPERERPSLVAIDSSAGIGMPIPATLWRGGQDALRAGEAAAALDLTDEGSPARAGPTRTAGCPRALPLARSAGSAPDLHVAASRDRSHRARWP